MDEGIFCEQFIPSMDSAFKIAILFSVVMAVIGAGWLGVAVYKELHWKQFAVVLPGKIYRSGLLKEHQLESAIQSLHLRTVICLDATEAPREKKICEAHGTQFLAFDMHSSGKGSPEDYYAIVKTMADLDSQPILVHCRAGMAHGSGCCPVSDGCGSLVV